MKQTTNAILLVRPKNIRTNEQTALNNYYQKDPSDYTFGVIQEMAKNEFDAFVEKLYSAGVKALVFDTKDAIDTPDAHFPNNWISFHENGSVVLYPMFAKNRRSERRTAVLDFVKANKFKIEAIVDYSGAEKNELFLEGTGSLILDRTNKKAYCALSQRANKELVLKFCLDFGYTPIIFQANQSVRGIRKAIYHTNVMMCIAETFAVICLNSIDNEKEKELVLRHLKSDNKEIIAITENQIENFAGNLLQVTGTKQERFLVMSTSAYDALNPEQIQQIEQHSRIIHSSLEMIEMCGGGSARCMMAEIFLNQED